MRLKRIRPGEVVGGLYIVRGEGPAATSVVAEATQLCDEEWHHVRADWRTWYQQGADEGRDVWIVTAEIPEEDLYLLDIDDSVIAYYQV